jgi:hypothetical protein
VPASQLERYRGALATLVESSMLVNAAASEVGA